MARKTPKHHMDHYDIVHTDCTRAESMNCYLITSYISVENIYNGCEELVVRAAISPSRIDDLYDLIVLRQEKLLTYTANRVRVLFNKAKFKGVILTNKNKKRLFKELNETFTANYSI